MLRTPRVALLVGLFAIATPLAGQTFVFDLSGAQEVPPVPTAAKGGCMGQLNQPAATFSITCVHNVISATVMHIHNGAPGVNGPIVFDFGAPTSPVTATWTGMTAQNINDVVTGNTYVNIHTAGRPAGEIRGQILSRTVDLVNFTATGSQVVPPVVTPETANCAADLDNPATSLAVNCTHNVPLPTAAHIHDAPAGQNGPAIFTFPSPASPLSANVPMTAQLVASFAAGFLYLDIHGGVEIRGQIGTAPSVIVIEKATFPGGGTGFTFTENILGGGFALNDGQSQAFTTTAGTYTVTENDPSASNHTLAHLSCNDTDSTVNLTTRTATINVAAGEAVTCRFEDFRTAATDQLFVFHLSGDQETPPVSTTRRGGCMGRFDAATNTLSLVCTHDVPAPTAAHIHNGAPGVSGPIVFDLGDPVSPIIASWSGMTPAEVGNLLAGNFYVNVHTATHPAGFIRGQILPRTVDTIAFTLDGSQVVPPTPSLSTGNCTADLDNPATALAVSCTHSAPAAVEAHVHRGFGGTNGETIHTFASPASPISQNVAMTPRSVADYAGGFLYLDVHTVAVTDDIRGQLAADTTDLTITKSGPATMTAGTDATYTVTVRNDGPFPADNVVVADTLPATMTFVSGSQTSGSTFNCTYPAAGTTGPINCTLSVMPAGTTATFSWVFRLASSAGGGGSVSNTATATTTTTDPVANNSSTATSTVTTSADLALTKTGPANATAGATIAYTISVSNGGPSAATSVTINDALPAGPTFASMVQTSGPLFNCANPAVGATGAVTCTIGTLDPGASSAFTLTLNISPSASGTLQNAATIASTTGDPLVSNNTSSTTANVGASADISVTKVGPAAGVPGANVSYTINVTNGGPSDAGNVALMDTVPPGTTFVSMLQNSGPVFTCVRPAVGGTGTVTCTIATLAAGSTSVFTLTLNLSPGTTGTLQNTSTVSTTATDPAVANNSSTWTSSTPRRGDTNGDGILSSADIFYLINHLFANGPPPLGSGDVNGDGTAGVPDIFYLINHLFTYGPPPPP